MESENNRSRGFSWARAIGRILVGGFVVGAFAVVVALVLFPPAGYLRQILTDAVTKATGRPFTFAGDPEISFNPRPVVVLQRVALGAPEGVPGPETVRADRVEAQLDPLSLLSGKIGLDHVTVSRASITVRPEDAGMAPAPGAATTNRPTGGWQVTVGELRVVESAVNYLVAHPNPAWRVDQVNATVTGISGPGPVKTVGRLRWRGEIVEVDGSLARLADVATDGGAPLKLTAASRRINATIDGRVSSKAPSLLAGSLQANTTSARDVLRWLGDMNFGPYALSGPATLDGSLNVGAGEARLEKATLKMDAGEGQWDVRFAFAGARPRVDGTIAWKELDLQRLMGEAPVPQAAAAALEARPMAIGPVIESAWQSLAADLAQVEIASGGGVAAQSTKATEKSQGWSTQPIDLSALAAADVDLTSTAAVVKYGRIDLRNSQTHLGIRDGKLAYTVKQVEIGGGRADGKIELDGTQKPARVAVGVRAADVPAESVLAQLFKSLLVSGTTKLDVGVEGRGRTLQEIISSLAGKADLAVRDGAFHGFDLRRSLLTWWRPQKFDPSARTRVQTMTGQFALSDGVLRTASPFTVDGDVRMSAEGFIEIARRSLDQNVKIRVAPPPDHLSVPVRVTGNWSQPKIAWDWKSIFDGQGIVGSPLSIAPAEEPLPAEIREQIARILAGPAGASLQPGARQVLEQLGGS